MKTEIFKDGYVAVQVTNKGKTSIIMQTAKNGDAYTICTVKEPVDEDTLNKYLEEFIIWAGKVKGERA